MGHFSKTELNLTHFYTKHQRLLALWKDLAKLNQKQVKSLEKCTFWCSYAGKKYMAPQDPRYIYLIIWSDERVYDVIKCRTYTSSYT